LKGLLTVITLSTVLLAGCASTSGVSAPVDTGVETVAFTTDALRVDVIDVATAVLVQHDFTITLANERLGLLQTDYASVSGIEAMRADSGRGDAALADLYIRMTVNAEDRGGVRYVQVKGNFQRMRGGQAPDRLIGLYWMERLVADLADGLDAEYIARVSNETYDQALGNAALPSSRDSQAGQVTRGLRAVAIVGAVLFAVTLAVGVFQPSGSR
jgi:outer membrane murein-binding lipoprotein Lpp